MFYNLRFSPSAAGAGVDSFCPSAQQAESETRVDKRNQAETRKWARGGKCPPLQAIDESLLRARNQ
jgi:hypothetical protein